MNESQQVKALLSNFERSNATGSLKAANISLGKILALIQKQIDAMTGTPEERAALAAATEELNDLAVAGTMTEAVVERVEEPSSHYEAAQAIVEDPAAITANKVEVPEPEMPESELPESEMPAPEVVVVVSKGEDSVEEAQASEEPKAEEKAGDAADEAAEDAPKNRRGRK